MRHSKLKYLVVLLLSCLFLTGLALASSDCEEVMTCCDSPPVESLSVPDCEPVKALCCASTDADSCSCSLNSEPPTQANRDFLFSSVRMDFQVQSYRLIVLPKEKTLAQDKPMWPPPEDLSWETLILPLCSFPNPPPAAA